MLKIPDNFVNLIIADPPYNIGKDYGDNSDKQNKSDYIENIKKWIFQFNRILKDNGTLIIYTGKQFNAHYRIEIENYFDKMILYGFMIPVVYKQKKDTEAYMNQLSTPQKIKPVTSSI